MKKSTFHMANCEEDQCDHVPSAICLHCHLQLCIPHLVEHDSRIFKENEQLSRDIDQLIEQLNISKKNIDRTYHKSMEKLNQWKDDQLEKIDQQYEKVFREIQVKKDQLIELEKQLSQQLIEQAIQPLDHIRKRQNANVETYQIIRQTIQDITKQNAQFENDLSSFETTMKISPEPVIIKPTNSSPVSILPKNPIKRPKMAHSRTLTRSFRDSSGHSDKTVERYIVKTLHQAVNVNNLMILLLSFLRATRSDSSSTGINENIFQHYIKIIQKYINGFEHQLTIIAACQVYVTSCKCTPTKSSNMISHLFELFCKAQCLTEEALVDWSINGAYYGYDDYFKAKEYAQTFLDQLHEMKF